MRLVQARSGFNKLEVFDNRVFAIERVELLPRGFKVCLFDLEEGKGYEVSYADRISFDVDWEFCENVKGDRKRYDGFEGYAD